MPNQLIERKQERETKRKALNQIVETAEAENRMLSAPELETLKAGAAEIKDLENQISVLEEIEIRNKQQSLETKRQDPKYKELAHRYSLTRSIRNWAKKKPQEGADLELIMEDRKNADVKILRDTPDPHVLYIPAEKMPLYEMTRGGSKFLTRDGRRIYRAQDLAGVADLITTGQAQDIDIVQSAPLYMTVGARVYPGLVGNFDLPASDQNQAAFVAEKAALPAAENATKATLTPRRVGITDEWTSESIASMTEAVLGDFLADMSASIDRAITLEMNTQVSNLTSLGATNIDWAAIVAQQTSVEDFANGAWMTSRKMEGLLRTLSKDAGSGQFVWTEGGTIAGDPALGTFLMPAAGDLYVLYGDWSGANIGFWGGMEMVRDPYSKSDTGEQRISVFRVADVKVRNPKRFAVNTDVTQIGGVIPTALIEGMETRIKSQLARAKAADIPNAVKAAENELKKVQELKKNK